MDQTKTMDEVQFVEVARMFANERRLQIVRLLVTGDKTMPEICSALQMKQPDVANSLSLLRAVRLVTGTRKGKSVVNSLDLDMVLQFCEKLKNMPKTQPVEAKAAPKATPKKITKKPTKKTPKTKTTVHVTAPVAEASPEPVSATEPAATVDAEPEKVTA